MTEWIEFARKVNHPVYGPSTPEVHSIKLPAMSRTVWFSTTGKAKVSDSVADLLVSAVDEVQYTDSTNTGEVIGEISGIDQGEVTVDVPDGYYDHLDANSINVDSGFSLSDLQGADPLSVAELVADKGTGQMSVTGDALTGPHVDVDRVSHGKTVGVRTKTQLQNAFNNLSAGDTIYIYQPATPYRTDQWLDIDVDDVTVIAEAQFAEDGQPIIKVADNANVGGIRIGDNAHCEGITIQGVGFHGNTNNQDQTQNRLHGFIADDSAHVKIRNCFATRLSPRHKHGTGGSGITARQNSKYVTINNNWVDDTGDRGIQVSGTEIQIVNNVCTNGYDRSIAMSVSENPTGNDPANYYAKNVIVDSNIGYNNSSGSIIGCGGDPTGETAPRQDCGRFVVSNNIGFGNHRGLITMFAEIDDLIVVGNYGESGNVDGIEIGRESGYGVKRAVVVGNHVRNYGSFNNNHHGITIENSASHVAVVGNTVYDAKKYGLHIKNPYTHHMAISGNVFANTGGPGALIESGGGRLTMAGNVFDNPGHNGIEVKGGGMSGSTVGNNSVVGAGNHGIRIAGSVSGVAFTGNTVRRAQNHGIIHDTSGINAITGNVLDKNSQTSVGTKQGILIQSGRANIVGNLVMSSDHQYGIMESATTGPSNVVGNYIANWNGGSYSAPFNLQHPNTTAMANYPAFDMHRGLSPGSGSVTVTFDKPYAKKPSLDINTEAVAMTGITSWSTDANGNYTAATVSLENAAGAVNPTTHVDVSGRE